MGVYLLTSGLRKVDQNYEKLDFEIKLLANDKKPVKRLELVDKRENFIEVMESVWLLNTHLGIEEIYSNLEDFQTNKLLIIEANENFKGYLDSHVWDWLEAKFKLFSY